MTTVDRGGEPLPFIYERSGHREWPVSKLLIGMVERFEEAPVPASFLYFLVFSFFSPSILVFLFLFACDLERPVRPLAQLLENGSQVRVASVEGGIVEHLVEDPVGDLEADLVGLTDDDIRAFRDRFNIPIERIAKAPAERVMDLSEINCIVLFATRLKEPQVIYLDNLKLADFGLARTYSIPVRPYSE